MEPDAWSLYCLYFVLEVWVQEATTDGVRPRNWQNANKLLGEENIV
jgi:hypothetical protein